MATILHPVVFIACAATLAAAETRIGKHTFTHPDEFTVEAVALPPLVDRPITLAFDESGALYVADSSGSNEKVEKQLAEKPHRILRLVDRDGDGRFDTPTVFADRMMFPAGTLWHEGSLYVAAPPQIWKLTDTDADGIADRREVWFDGKTLTDCANDLHGPYAGPDGYLYWCKGAFAEQAHALADGSKLTTRAAHVFRARPDGSGLESVMAGGMDNPVDVAFSPAGERFLSGTFFVHPGGGQRDGILHAVYGGVWGKDHSALAGRVRTGDLMPVMTHLGPAAPSGLEVLRSTTWPAEWSGNLLACQFNLRKVSRHALKPHGASFQSSDSDLLTSDQTDFHPTDVIEDADGSILVADTGGWYKLCCPTSQLHRPEALGGIYRLRRKGAPAVEDPRGLRMDWLHPTIPDLAQRLADPRPAVAERATRLLAARGEPAVTPVAVWLNSPRPGANAAPLSARLNAVWTLTRIQGDAARAAVRFAFADRDSSVRIAAATSAGLWRDRGAAEALVNHLTHPDAHLRRASIEALGRIGEESSLSRIPGTFTKPADRFIEHAVAFALIESRNAAIARTLLARSEPAAVRCGLASLHALDGLQPRDLIHHLVHPDATVRSMAEWIAGERPAWAPELAAWLRTQVENAAPESTAQTGTLLSRFANHGVIQELIAHLATAPAGDRETPEQRVQRRQIAFSAMERSGLKTPPTSWTSALITGIGESTSIRSSALQSVRRFTGSKDLPLELRAALLRIGESAESRIEDRFAALSALPGRLGKPGDELFALLLRESREGGILRAKTAAQLLQRSDLSPAQLMALSEALPHAPANALPALLEIFRTRTDEATSRLLLAQLPRIHGLPAATLRSILEKHPVEIRTAAEKLLAPGSLDAQSKRLEELLAEIPKGDPARGHQLFKSAKAACTTCHAMAYVGGNLGPDLTRIGSIRSERDLLEAIVFPSSSFVRSYESVLVKSKDANEVLGIIRKDDAEEMIVATGPGTESRLSRAAVTDVAPSPISLMPPGYDGILSPQELADLVAFLKQAK